MALSGVQYATTGDGAWIAYRSEGQGPPVVVAPGLNVSLDVPLATEEYGRAFLGFWSKLARDFTVIRYDMRGTGLSQRSVGVVGVESMVADLAAVVDAARAEATSIVGISHGGQAAIRFSAQHPERVTRLALFGAFASLSGKERATARAMSELYQANWGVASGTLFRLMRPDSKQSQSAIEDFALRQRKDADRDVMVQLMQSNAESDHTAYLPRIQAPTIIVHGQDDRLVPFHHARELATSIPNAELVPSPSNHGDWFIGAEGDRIHLLLKRFFGGSAAAGVVSAPLSEREIEVLRFIAAGDSNRDIADRFTLSIRTVERHASNIYAKIGVTSRAEAVRWALENGLG